MPDHISYSQINTYLTCPLRYKFQYVDKLPWPFVPSGLLFGTAVHRVLAYYYDRRQKGIDVTGQDILMLLEKYWDDSEKQKPIKYKNSENKLALIKQAKELLGLYLTKLNEQEIVGIEKEFKIEFSDDITKEKLQVPLVGIMDLQLKDKTGDLIVVDIKTAARDFTEDRIENDLQITCYSYVAEKQNPELKGKILLRFDVLLKNKIPEVVTYYCFREEKDHRKFFQIAKNVLKGIASEVFYPKPGFYCAECPFYDPCQRWQDEIKPIKVKK